MGKNLELAIGALNGVIGDYLKRTDNGLATAMHVVRDGAPLALSREGLAAAFPEPPRRVAVLVHGLMSMEAVWQMAGGETYGSLLAKDLGYAAIDVRYNSGLHISENGEALDALLTELVSAYPGAIDEMVVIGHSMGGLVLRSATHVASGKESVWLPLVKRAFYVGSPHLGAPLERFGNLVTWVLGKIDNPITSLIADIVNLRSGGVKDLRYGNLRREDWEGADANALLQNRRHPVPLLPQIRHHLVAGSLSADPRMAVLFGDAMVSLRSATGRAKPADRMSPLPQEHVAILSGFNHLRLAHDPAVYGHIRAWCEEALQ
jgi:triacylglycerol lipase